MQMPNRSYSASGSYRYGFNGKESDSELSGSGNQYDYGFRIYNPRIGRFLSVDPLYKSYPWYTPYQFAGNRPVWAIDLDGLEEYLVTNYYDSRKRISQTTIAVVNSKDGGREDMKLQDAKGHYLAKNVFVLVRNVQPNGRTTYERKSQLGPEEANIVTEANKELIEPKKSPFGLAGGRTTGLNGGGDFFSSERQDYTNDKYELAEYTRLNKYLPDVNKLDKGFATIYLNHQSDNMVDNKGNSILNGKVFEFSHELMDMPSKIKKDKTVTSIDVNLNWDVGADIDDSQLQVMQRAIGRTGEEIKKLLQKSGVQNVRVHTNVNRTNEVHNQDALTVTLNH